MKKKDKQIHEIKEKLVEKKNKIVFIPMKNKNK